MHQNGLDLHTWLTSAVLQRERSPLLSAAPSHDWLHQCYVIIIYLTSARWAWVRQTVIAHCHRRPPPVTAIATKWVRNAVPGSAQICTNWRPAYMSLSTATRWVLFASPPTSQFWKGTASDILTWIWLPSSAQGSMHTHLPDMHWYWSRAVQHLQLCMGMPASSGRLSTSRALCFSAALMTIHIAAAPTAGS